MSDTLRTDDAQFEAYAGAFRRVVVPVELARQLERELAEAQKEIEAWSRRYADLEAMYLAAKQS